MNKTKRAHIRLTEEQELFIEGKELSKSKIFELGYAISELHILRHSVEVTVKLKDGSSKTYILSEKGHIISE